MKTSSIILAAGLLLAATAISCTSTVKTKNVRHLTKIVYQSDGTTGIHNFVWDGNNLTRYTCDNNGKQYLDMAYLYKDGEKTGDSAIFYGDTIHSDYTIVEGRMVSEFEDGYITEFEYDRQGHLTLVKGYSIEGDPSDRIKEEYEYFRNNVARATATYYDSLGNVSYIKVTEYLYDTGKNPLKGIKMPYYLEQPELWLSENNAVLKTTTSDLHNFPADTISYTYDGLYPLTATHSTGLTATYSYNSD